MARNSLVMSEKLDRKITLERKTVVQNEFGEEVETWATLAANIWASKSYHAAGENVQAAEIAAVRVLRFVIRWNAAWEDLSPLDRLTHEGKTYDITEVNEITRREGIEIFAKVRAE